MDIYKLGNQLGLRFPTTKGLLSIEQLFTLNQTQLAGVVKGCKKVLKGENDDELSFLDDNTSVNKEDQLRFDIAKDIYLTKKAETDELRTKAERKAFEQKILGLIAEKQEDSLKGKSIEELEAMLAAK
jgi:hypothetical protein